MMTTAMLTRAPEKVDYELALQLLPGMCLVLDPGFTILAQNTEHAKATLSIARDVVGRNLFDAFADNPDHSAADGAATVRSSLLKVLKTRQADAMPVIRYDVKAARGGFQPRYGAITNTPILDADRYVRWIIKQAEDGTELVPCARRPGSGPASWC